MSSATCLPGTQTLVLLRVRSSQKPHPRGPTGDRSSRRRDLGQTPHRDCKPHCSSLQRAESDRPASANLQSNQGSWQRSATRPATISDQAVVAAVGANGEEEQVGRPDRRRQEGKNRTSKGLARTEPWPRGRPVPAALSRYEVDRRRPLFRHLASKLSDDLIRLDASLPSD
jgi:hypothetical protein